MLLKPSVVAVRLTLLALAVLAVALTVTWVQMPTKERQTVAAPASWFAGGLTKHHHPRVTWGGGFRVPAYDSVDVEALRKRVKTIFGGAAAVMVLVGLAFSARSRTSS